MGTIKRDTSAEPYVDNGKRGAAVNRAIKDKLESIRLEIGTTPEEFDKMTMLQVAERRMAMASVGAPLLPPVADPDDLAVAACAMLRNAGVPCQIGIEF